jgi:type IX secretion system PorP/SprF family membrane protein
MRKELFLQAVGKCLLRHFWLIGILLSGLRLQAQDTHFSQYYMSPLTQNPALAGALFDLQALVNYRSQWQSVAVPFTTMAASFDMRLNKRKAKHGYWAAGINVYNDKAGDLQMSSTQVNLSAAYHVRLNDYNTLGAGLQGGFAQRSINYGAIRAGNQYNGNAFDGSLPTGESLSNASILYADAGAGLIWTYNNTSGSSKVTDNHDLKINVGVALFHPHQPDYSYYKDGEKLYMRFALHGNALISFPSTNLAIVPGFLVYRQGPAQEIYAGTMLRYKLKQDSKYTGFSKGAALSLGAYYRAGDAVAATMLLEFSNYAMGISYDVNSSRLKTASNARGGFEITLRFVSPNPFVSGAGSSSSKSRF